jgi:hypothetical protein
MAAEFTVGAGEQRIKVRCVESAPSAEKQSLARNLNSTVSLTLGAFSGSFNAVFTIQQIEVLREQLVNALVSGPGKVLFRNLVGDLLLEIEFNGQGKGIISGTIQPHGLRQATLSFRFDAEESSLARTAEELDDALHSFAH